MFRLSISILFLAFAARVIAEPRDLSPELEKLRVEYKLPACATAVVDHGKIIAIGASGLRRVDANVPVTTADVWHIGSCTKSMTATLVGVMVDAGTLRWDEPVAEALPGVACDPAWQKITVWDLVTHRSGLRRTSLSDELRTADRKAFARALLSSAPAEPPGKSVYSNAGYGLLGAILEAASGESYEEMLRRHIFAPLALKTAGFGAAATPGQLDQPWGHRRREDRLVPVEPAPSNQFPLVLAPAGCVHLSLPEFARYANWVATNEPRLVTPETFARLHTPPEGIHYAGGVWETEFPGIGGKAFCHTGHMGGSFATFYAGNDFACVTVFNMEGGSWDWIGDEIAGAILKALR